MLWEFMKTGFKLTIFFQKKNIGGTDLSMLKDSINGYLKSIEEKGVSEPLWKKL